MFNLLLAFFKQRWELIVIAVLLAANVCLYKSHQICMANSAYKDAVLQLQNQGIAAVAKERAILEKKVIDAQKKAVDFQEKAQKEHQQLQELQFSDKCEEAVQQGVDYVHQHWL